MGHIRLGRLPTAKKWQQVVALLERNASVDAIAAQAASAAEEDLAAGAADPGFIRACWLLAQVPLAARGPDFADALQGLGLAVGRLPELFEIGSALSESVDRYVDGMRRRTDFGEMAQLAAAESLNAVASRSLPSLFASSPDDVQRAIGRLASGKLFGELAHDFFSRLTRRHLDYFLCRELANHIGQGRCFETITDRADFDAAMEVHCREAARIVREFAGGWFGKAAYQRGAITEADTGRYAAYALKKIRAELRKRRGADD
jgi:hypothetical protein